MTKEEIRNLLGGYATNTLTESERKALFEAALEDQELFNALQQEQALKELLADPASRAQVRQALEQPPVKLRAAWWARWWTWAGAASAVAAAAIVFVVVRSNGVPPLGRPVQIASTREASPEAAKEIAPEPAQLRTSESKPQPKEQSAHPPDQLTARRKEEPASLASNSPPPPPPAAAPTSPALPPTEHDLRVVTPRAGAAGQLGQQQVQGQAPGGANSFRQTFENQSVSPQVIAQLGAAAAGAVSSYDGPLLRYSVVKHEANGTDSPLTEPKAGDSVRFTVSTGVPGYLALYQLNAAGQANRVAGTIVAANSTTVLPDSPITVQSTAQRFRLALSPIASQLQTATGSGGGGGAKDAVAPSVPLVVEITLAGK